METTKPLNIHQRILGVMKDVEYIAKGKNLVNGMYRFVSHDAVVGKLHSYLVKHGITVIPCIEKWVQAGNRTEVELVVSFVNADEPTDHLNVRTLGFGIDNADKGPGKAVSYALKYALLKVFCLETGDDPDQDQQSNYEPAKCQEFDSALPVSLTPEDRETVKSFVEEIAKTTGRHVEDVKREAVKRMPEFVEAFEKKRKKK